MFDISDDFLEAIRQGHDIASRVTIYDGSDDPPVVDEVTDGTVTVDAQAAMRHHVDQLTFVNSSPLDLGLVDADSLLAPFGNEVFLERGIAWPDRDPEYCPLGVYRFETSTQTSDGLTVITGNDRSAKISEARFEQPRSIAAGTNIGEAILDGIFEHYDGIEYDFAETDREFSQPYLLEEQGDPWAAYQNMAGDIGFELFFNGRGIPVFRPIAIAVSGSPVDELAEGEGGVLIDVDKGWDRGPAYNKVIVTGEGTGVEGEVLPRGEAFDDNPASPTYYYGKFGHKPMWFPTPLVGSDSEAENTAAGRLAGVLGIAQTINLDTIPNPALEPNDVVRVRRDQLDLDEDNVLDGFTISLAADKSMGAKTRATAVL